MYILRTENAKLFTVLLSFLHVGHLHILEMSRTSNMATSLSGQTSIFGVVSLVSKSLSRIGEQKKLKKKLQF